MKLTSTKLTLTKPKLKMPSKNAGMLSVVSASVLLLSALAASKGQAQALALGSHFVNINFTKDGGKTSGREGGGSVSSSTLEGVALPFVYCVDLDHNIGVPNTYTPTPITTNGTAYGSAIHNGGQVAWLLDHYGFAATTDDLQGGLQASIWHAIYGSNYYIVSGGDTTAGELAAYNTDTTALGNNTDPVSNIKWLSPSDSNNTHYQALVTISNVPEPGVITLAAGILVSGSVFTVRRRRSKQK